MKPFLLLSSFLFLFQNQGVSQSSFDRYQRDVVQIYEHTLAFRFDEAKELLTTSNLDEHMPEFSAWLKDYRDFLWLFSREQKADLETWKNTQPVRIESIQSSISNDTPWFYYLQADMYWHRALIHIEFKEYYQSIRFINRANKLLKAGHAKFPDFMPILKSLGFLQLITSSIPESYQKALTFFTSLSVDIDNGKKQLWQATKDVDPQTSWLQQESVSLAIRASLDYLNAPEEALHFLEHTDWSPESSISQTYFLAMTYRRLHQPKRAMEIVMSRPKSQDYTTFPALSYWEAVFLQQSFHPEAFQAFNRFIETSPETDFVKSAHLRLAWIALDQQDTVTFHDQILKTQQQGRDWVGADQEAAFVTQKDYQPAIPLIHARLFYDGGEMDKALNALKSYQPQTKSDYLEYHYRLGRIYAIKEEWGKAQTHLDLVIDQGSDQPYYFAGNAAIVLGIRGEALADISFGETYYKKALQMKPKVYRMGIHAQAKSGLKRLELLKAGY